MMRRIRKFRPFGGQRSWADEEDDLKQEYAAKGKKLCDKIISNAKTFKANVDDTPITSGELAHHVDALKDVEEDLENISLSV